MAYSRQIAEGLRELFEQLSIKARFEDKDSIGLFTIEMKLHGKLNTARMMVIVRENNFSTLIQNADQALYRAKRKNKGGCCLWKD